MTDTPSSGKRSVTDRVNDRLVAGNYESYSQIAREEGTTKDFVSKRAHELRKQGKLAGDRRSKARQPGIGEDDIGIIAEPLTDKIFEQRMAAYKMLGVPEAEIKTMEAGRFDLAGLRKAKEQIRLLKYDRRVEELTKAFSTLAALSDFIGFYNDVRKTGVSRSDYATVMSKVQESMTLDDQIREQRAEVTTNGELLADKFGQYLHYKDLLESLEKNCKEYAENKEYYEGVVGSLASAKNELEQFFNGMGEGTKFHEKIRKIVFAEIDKFMQGFAIWRIVLQVAYVIADKYPSEFADLGRSLRMNNTQYINENAQRFGKLFLEAEQLLNQQLAYKAAQIVRKEITQPYRNPLH